MAIIISNKFIETIEFVKILNLMCSEVLNIASRITQKEATAAMNLYIFVSLFFSYNI